MHKMEQKPLIFVEKILKLIREFRTDLPIVAQTAFSSKEDKESVFTAGFNDFISKPISKEALSEVIVKQKKK